MTIPEAKTIKIGDIEFPNVKWRSRIVFEYETMTGESYYKIGTKVESQFKLFYCAAKVGSAILNKEFNYTYDQFLDLTDDYYTETINQFTDALYSKVDLITEDKKKAK
jgi:hypothetical protein